MIVRHSSKYFWDLLKALEGNSNYYPSRYTKGAQSYIKQRPLDNLASFIDCSFICCKGEDPVIGFLGAIDVNKESQNLACYEGPCVVIYNDKINKNLTKEFIVELNNILLNLKGSFWYRDFLIGGKISFLTSFLLLKGATSYNIFSQVIDLTLNEDELRSNLRRRYKALINYGIKELAPKIYNSNNITWDLMLNFMQLHIQVSGRRTRSELSWKRQFEMVKNNEAFLIMGHIDGILVTAGFFSYSLQHCYYGSSASDRSLFDKPIFHSLMWTAILYAKKMGCIWFETGERIFNSKMKECDLSKVQGISDFKAGFGGDTRVYMELELKK
jgi:hypothetical protein